MRPHARTNARTFAITDPESRALLTAHDEKHAVAGCDAHRGRRGQALQHGNHPLQGKVSSTPRLRKRPQVSRLELSFSETVSTSSPVLTDSRPLFALFLRCRDLGVDRWPHRKLQSPVSNLYTDLKGTWTGARRAR